jgi:hypothetical protein
VLNEITPDYVRKVAEAYPSRLPYPTKCSRSLTLALTSTELLCVCQRSAGALPIP